MGELIPKPWGHYVDHFRSLECVFKIITVDPHSRLSLQYHLGRSEVWLCLSGAGEAVVGHQTQRLQSGSKVEINIGETHQLRNVGDKPLVVAEMQCGECDENDIVRIEDDYGRKN
jgi:mannose-6-phosphate isomerase-like protein (cupin superfamily)